MNGRAKVVSFSADARVDGGGAFNGHHGKFKSVVSPFLNPHHLHHDTLSYKVLENASKPKLLNTMKL
jgi:hypothetical protein